MKGHCNQLKINVIYIVESADDNDGEWTYYPKRSSRVVDFGKGIIGIAKAVDTVYHL
jgi:hypothetical protein